MTFVKPYTSQTDRIKEVSEKVHDRNSGIDQFAVSQTPFHTHNGADSQNVNFKDLIGRYEFVNQTLSGTTPATAGNYGVFFIAPYPCIFMGATEVHQTAGSDGSAVTVQIEKLTGITASGSGTNLLITGFNMKGVANTVQTAQKANIRKNLFNLDSGDRLGLVLSGTPTSIASATFIVQLSY